MVIKAFPDGSFDMCPGFNRAGFKYRFEDEHGEEHTSLKPVHASHVQPETESAPTPQPACAS